MTASLAATPIVGRAAWGVRRSDADIFTPHAARNTQNPTLGPAVFAQRIGRAVELPLERDVVRESPVQHVGQQRQLGADDCAEWS